MLKINSKAIVGFVVALALFAGVSGASAAWTASTATKIKKGSPKADVLWLQQTLNATVKAGLKEDGLYGAKTTAAIKAFQKANPASGLADGIAGKKTIAALNAAGANAGSTTGTTPTTPVVAQSGTLTVSASSTMPAPMNVPTGASSVKVGDFVFTAPSNSPVTVSTLTFKHLGVGSVTEISNAYIYDGANRLTSGRTFNSSTNEATFTINVTLAAGQSKVLSLLVSTTGSLAGTHKFSLVSMSSVAVSSGVTVMGNFPITTNEMTISAVSAGTISIDKNGSLTNPRVGDKAVEVSEFKLSPSTEDAWVNQVTLTQGGSIANSALSNFVLKQNGVTVASASAIASNSRLALVFSPAFKIEKGNSRVFQLYADVAGRPNDTISFYVDEAADTIATGGTYNYGMTASTTTSFDQSSDTGLTLTLQGGQFTLTFTGPAAKNISNTANDVSVWEGSIYTANTVEVRHWHVRIQDTNAADPDLADVAGAAIQDIKIWNTDNNTIIAGPKELTVGANNQSEQLTFNDTYTLNAGSTTHIKITVDVKNNPAGNITLLATLGDGTNSFTQGDIKNIDSNTYLTQTSDVSPSGVIVGYNQTVTAAGLTLNTSSSPTDSTIVKGAKDVAVTAFDFVVGSGDAVKINSLTVTAGMSGTNDNTYGALGAADTSTTVNDLILSAKLMDGTTQVGTTKSFSSGTATFDNLNWTIPASTTKKLSVVISTNSSATIVSTTDFLRVSIAAAGVNAVDSQGNTVTGASTLHANDAGSSADVVVTVSDGGTLTTAIAANPTSGLMYGGATMRSFAAYKFSAQNDAFYVKKFVLIPYVGGSASSASNSRISNLQVTYKNQAGATVNQTVGLSGTSTNVDISANPMYVPANGDATLQVVGDLSAFTILDGSEDANITFALKGTDSTNNQATGVGSNADVSGGVFNAADLVGNKQYVYRTNLSVAAGTASNGATKARSASDKVASYNFSSVGGATSSYFRGSKKAPDSSATGWAASGGGTAATIATATNYVTGASAITSGASTANTASTLAYDFGATAGLNNYNRVSAWVKVVTSAGTAAVTFAVSPDANLATPTGTPAAVATATTTATWYYVDVSTSSQGVIASSEFVGVKAAAAGAGNTVTMTIDDLRFYNDSATITVTGTLNSTAPVAQLFTLKDNGGTIRAYGAYNGTGGTGGTGTVVLIPGDGADVSAVTNYSDVEIASGSSLALDLYTSTSALMATDTTANEVLSVSATTGTPSSAGSFAWYDNSDSSGGNNQAAITVVNPISTTIDFSNNY